jgi:predicted MPP superfamily phosphohydrolase
MKKQYKIWWILSGILVLLIGFLYWQNNDLVVSNYQVDSGLEESIKIVHLSDLHSKEFGENNERLLKQVEEEEPDLIFVTGDLVDQKDDALDGQLDYMEDLNAIAPVYVVFGNHEYWSDLDEEIKSFLEDRNIVVLDNEVIYMNVKGHYFQLIGLSDEASGQAVEDVFMELVNPAMYNIVLYHQTDQLDLFAEHSVDLVFSGHAHGGQVRLPLLGGLYAPNQGFLPEYTSGLYEEEETTMVVSRGLANSVIPFRVFNRPEILVLTIE